MGLRTSQVKIRKIIGEYYAVPVKMTTTELKKWLASEKALEVEDSDIEIGSLLDIPPDEKRTIAKIIENGDFPLNKPRLIG